MVRLAYGRVFVTLSLWLLAGLGWALLAAAPLHRPSPETLRIGTPHPLTFQTQIPEGHRILDTWWPETLAVFLLGAGAILWPRYWPLQTALIQRVRQWIIENRCFVLILCASMCVRIALAYCGGQYFDADEYRYVIGPTSVLYALSHADWRQVLLAICGLPAEHPGFKVIGLVPALFHSAAASWSGRSVADMSVSTGEWIAAAILSMSSVLVIAEVYWLALKLGASKAEAQAASMLAACSTTLFFYSRNLFPYDASIAFGLASVGLAFKRNSSVRALLSGLLAGFAFTVYNGYWTLVALAGVAHLLFTRPPWTGAMKRAAIFSVGCCVFPGLFLLGWQLTGSGGLQDILTFSQEVTHGDFEAGFRLPWQFFWHAERGIFLVWIVAAAVLLWPVRRRVAVESGISITWTPRRRGLMWLGLAAVVYGMLVLGSNVAGKFVVYDRSARPLVPFLCLAAAAAWHRGISEVRGARPIAFVVLVAHFIMNTAPLFTLSFPREVAQMAAEKYGIEHTEGGSSVAPTANSSWFFLQIREPEATGSKRYLLLNAKDIWLESQQPSVVPQPAGVVVYRTRHPRQLFLYQYHGYTDQVREWVRRTDLSIQLVDRKN